MPQLAVKIGLNEAIILQQMHYWIRTNKAVKNNYIDGHYWIYNTYDQWQQQFPFFSKSTIWRTVDKLERLGLVISGNYNKAGMDRTKWYTIDYGALEALEEPCAKNPQNLKASPFGQNDNMEKKPETLGASPFVQIEEMHLVNLTRPIPETTTETSSSSTPSGDNQILSNIIDPDISPPAANLQKTISAGAEAGQNYNEIVKLYENNIGQLNPVSLDKLMTYCKDHGKEFMIAVIDYAASNNARSITYIDNVIENLAQAGANTPEKIADHLTRYRNERKQAREAWRRNRSIKQKQQQKVYGMVGDKQGDGKPKPGKYEDFYLS